MKILLCLVLAPPMSTVCTTHTMKSRLGRVLVTQTRRLSLSQGRPHSMLQSMYRSLLPSLLPHTGIDSPKTLYISTPGSGGCSHSLFEHARDVPNSLHLRL
ncbi:uncharacterized protein EV420DRAFT_1026787 [Desarmillaria tabescens]|uniref:Secreted protein n=1 Tax=Armillaria tabescens TaxID=1929756 RepID=A0AA39MRP0_ARMTA|nr:uncharacterized protein EV420DRAFT_1026787 [Desarmillaria tabescens]KAK0443330.1 hypothetical protein EV420DRAFT_1026787 [Desarmillaria tabescens]